MARSSWLAPLLAIAPLAVLWVGRALIEPRPYWCALPDPELVHYYCGMSILEGGIPENVHHPATPLHWLSALLLWVVGIDPLQVDRFRTLGYALVLALDFAAMGLLARTLLRGLPLSLQVAALWTFFLCPAALRFSLIWSPEILFFAAGAVVLAACDRLLRGEPRLAAVALAGAAIGLACGIKLTWLSWVAGLCVLLALGPRVPRAGRIAAVAVALGGVALGFVTATWLVLPRYPYMFDWVGQLATHSGRYGVGPREWPDPVSSLTEMAGQIGEASTWTAWWSAWLLVVLVGLWLRRRRGEARPPAVVGWVLLSVTVLVTSHLIALRDPWPRYLLPGGMGVVALVAAAGRVAPFWRRRAARILAVGGAGALLFLGLQADWREHRDLIEGCTSTRARIEARVRQHLARQPDATVIYAWQAPIPSLALRLNGWRHPAALQAIERRFPREGHYNPWANEIFLPTGAEDWDLLVIHHGYWPSFPERERGQPVDRVGGYLIVRRTP